MPQMMPIKWTFIILLFIYSLTMYLYVLKGIGCSSHNKKIINKKQKVSKW